MTRSKVVLIQYSIFVAVAFTSALAILKLLIEPLIFPSYLGFDGVTGGIFVDVPIMKPIYDSSPYLLPLTWGALIGVIVWKGKVRSIWKKRGYDYDIFKVVARMRGSPMRVQLLKIMELPKNKLQLAKELNVDWRTIDNHVETLMKNGLVEEMAQVGTSRYYIISEHGKKVLGLLSGKSSDK
ncbi:MAG: hypothetical protein ACREAO_00540 [Nitrososphaera sp.]